MQTVLQDLRYAVRQLWKSPGFTITAVLTLAIGIGVNTAGFSIMDAVVLRPLAVPDLKHVVVVYEEKDHGNRKPVTLADFADLERLSHSFESLAVWIPDDLSLTGAGDPVHVQAERVSPNFFSVLRINAFLGRAFTQSEAQPGRDGVARPQVEGSLDAHPVAAGPQRGPGQGGEGDDTQSFHENPLEWGRDPPESPTGWVECGMVFAPG